MFKIAKAGINPCSSCGLCAVTCPQNAIDFGIDKDGFYRPTVNEKCTDCGICTEVCYKYLEEKTPFENIFRNKNIYAAWSKNHETVMASSSGGVGYELTKYYSDNGYKICGCIFDAPNDVCKHIIAKTDCDLDAIRTSKYLQRYTVNAFSQFKKNEKYLVIGAPCQIYGLRKYIKLKKWEDNFILVDFFCHGTPSVLLWRKYREYICGKYLLDRKLSNINFRCKNTTSTWHSYSVLFEDISGIRFLHKASSSNNYFYKFYLNNSCQNEACYQCKMRLDHCASDIRIADFWGKKYEKNDDGVSLVITNTEKGDKVWEEIQPLLVAENCNFEDLQDSQRTRFISAPKQRKQVMKALQKNNTAINKTYWRYFWTAELYWWLLRKGARVKRFIFEAKTV